MPQKQSVVRIRGKTSRPTSPSKSTRNHPRTSSSKQTLSKQKNFPIVGIGASAGGLEALSQLLTQLPSDAGIALVVVQHLDPSHESLSAEILSRTTRMPVEEIKDGVWVQPNHVYLIPPNHNLAILNGILSLTPRPDTRAPHLAVDFFFHSLAQDQKNRAIGVVLSGTGADGTQGLETIKAEGGLTIVQDPLSAKYDGMPHSAIASGAVDLVLKPKQIAEELVRIAYHPILAHYDMKRRTGDQSREVQIKLEGDSLTKIFALLRNQSHVDFSHYKPTTIKRRIARRMVILKKTKLEDYFSHLQANPQEIRALFTDILINVTEFFRDPDVFSALKKQVLSKIIKNKPDGAPIRIWVVGCATGEEAYSIAISLLELLEEADQKQPIQIFATDISEPALQKARAGVYPESIQKNVSKEQLSRFFEKTETGYKVAKHIRDICLFSRHDVTSDPPFSKVDLISCRNLLIYFDNALQKHVLPILHYALNPDGFLWLGRSESAGNLTKLFRVTDKARKFYLRGVIPATPRMSFGLNRYVPEIPERRVDKVSREISETSELQRKAEQALISQFAPPGVLVNSNMEITLIRGETAPYLKLTPGQASLNLFKMTKPELLPDLRMALQTATKRSAFVKKEHLSIQIGDQQSFVNISVIPLKIDPDHKERHYWILFEPASESLPSEVTEPGRTRKHAKGPAGKTIGLMERKIKELDRQVSEGKVYQQSLVEEFESTQEEITSANEELQSTNEELQSTNEEMETAKEELQSTNEELTTVNDELQNRNSDLARLNNDLINLIGSVDFPIIMVGSDSRIRRFTPAAGKMLNLIQSDVGRPIGDIRTGFNKPELQSLVSEVMESITIKEEEVSTHEGRTFRLQVRPYKTTDKRIDGAVISLIDITVLKEHLTESQAALKYATSVADTLSLPLVVLDENLHLMSANQGFAKMFEILPDKDVGSDLMRILGGKGWKIPRLRELLSEVITKDQALKDFEIEYDFPEIGHRIMLLNAQKIRWQETMPRAMLLSIDDISERKTLERSLEHSEERFRMVVEYAHDAIVIVDAKGKIEFLNKQALTWFGYTTDEVYGKSLEILIPERFRGVHGGYHEHYMVAPTPRPMGVGLDLFAKRKDGSEFPVDISLTPIKKGSETKVTAIIRNISETRKLSDERKTLLEHEKEARSYAEHAKSEAERANESKDVFLATLSHELRTPLTAIYSWSQLLQKKTPSPEILIRGLKTIEQSARAQGQLINDLLDISRIQSGKLSLNLTEVNPIEVVRAAIESIRLTAASRQISIEVLEGPQVGKVRGDPARLQQIVWNLLTNSVKFSPEGEKIKIHIENVQEHGHFYVSFRVVDHGKGIDPAFLPNIFTRFSQQDSSSTRVYGGLGIGLALVNDLVKSHGGSVKAESDGLGRGAIFTVILPMILEGKSLLDLRLDENKPLQKPESPDLSGLKVLIVDDEPSALEAFSEIVKSFGGEPIQCSSVRAAMVAFMKLRPDVVVSDIAMPVEDGYAFIAKVRALSPEQGGRVPAIALTAYAAHHDISRAIAAGFQEHMAKPFDSEEFGRTIFRLAKSGTTSGRRE